MSLRLHVPWNGEMKGRERTDADEGPLMADDEAHTGGDLTRYRALVAPISFLSQDRPDLKFASMRVYCAMAKPSMREENWQVPRRQAKSEVLVPLATESLDGRSQLESS